MDIVGEKYLLLNFIGSGGFGRVFKGKVLKNDAVIAIKLDKKKKQHLMIEDRILRRMQGTVGFPHRIWFGTFQRKNALVMEYLGKSLDYYLEKRKSFSLRTACILGLQAIDRLEALHNKCYIHRDIKPANMCMGKDGITLYLIDFGLGKLYKDRKSGLHIIFKEGKQLTGTTRYVSLATHNGIEQSRRDDIEGLYYVLIHMMQGTLPWLGLQRKTKFEKQYAVHQLKLEYPPTVLCKRLPPEIGQFGTHIRSLQFDQKPDYYYLRFLLQKIAQNHKFYLDDLLDWNGPTLAQQISKKLLPAKKQKRRNSKRMSLSDREVDVQQIQNSPDNRIHTSSASPPPSSNVKSSSYQSSSILRSSGNASMANSPHNSSSINAELQVMGSDCSPVIAELDFDVQSPSSFVKQLAALSQAHLKRDEDRNSISLHQDTDRNVLPVWTEQAGRMKEIMKNTKQTDVDQRTDSCVLM